MKALTAGVAIVTHNGLRYLPQQLGSIVSQSRSVSHIVVVDDRSSDGTRDYLDAWAAGAGIPVTIIRNAQRLGPARSAQMALGAVEADIVFATEQGDVWLPGKVETLAGLFEQDPDTVLVHTDALLVDADGRDTSRTLLEELAPSQAERDAIGAGNAFEVYCRRNLVTGATTAFRSSLLSLACPFPSSIRHDAWLALLAAATGRVRLLETPTILYRRHGADAAVARQPRALARMRHLWTELRGAHCLARSLEGVVSARAEVHRRLAGRPEVPPAYQALAREALEFAERRRRLPRKLLERAGAVLKHAPCYGRFSAAPWTDGLRDIVRG